MSQRKLRYFMIYLISVLQILFFLSSEKTLAFDKISIASIEYPPIVYSEKGKPQGIGVDIVTEALKAVNEDVKFQFYPIPRIPTTLMKGTHIASLGSAIWYQNENLMDKIESIDLFNVRFVIFYRKDKFPSGFSFHQIEDLRKYSIGNVRGSATTKLVENAKLRIDLAPNLNMAVKKLQAGRVDLSIGIDIAMWNQIKKEFPGSEDKFAFVDKSIFSLPISIVFKKEDRLNIQRFEKGLEIILKNGKFYKVLEKYYGPGKVDAHLLPESIQKKIIKLSK